MKTLAFLLLWSLPTLAVAQVAIRPVADLAGTTFGTSSGLMGRSMSLAPDSPGRAEWAGIGATASMTTPAMLSRGRLANSLSLARQVRSGLLTQGDRRSVRVSAQATPAGTSTNRQVTYPRLESGSKRNIWRRAVIASDAVAAGSAAIAHWSSGRGDDAYDRYLSSAGEERREDAFDDAERYDRIAGAAFLAMEAGLVLTAYFVFF